MADHKNLPCMVCGIIFRVPLALVARLRGKQFVCHPDAKELLDAHEQNADVYSTGNPYVALGKPQSTVDQQAGAIHLQQRAEAQAAREARLTPPGGKETVDGDAVTQAALRANAPDDPALLPTEDDEHVHDTTEVPHAENEIDDAQGKEIGEPESPTVDVSHDLIGDGHGPHGEIMNDPEPEEHHD